MEIRGVGNLVDLRRVKALRQYDLAELWTPDELVIPPADNNYMQNRTLAAGCMLLREESIWVELCNRPGAANWALNYNTNNSVVAQVNIEVKGGNAIFDSRIAELQHGKWVLVVEDMNGLVRLIGNKEQYCRAYASWNSNINAWNLRFETLLPAAPYYLPAYSNAILMGEDSGFDFSFNYSFES